ncbi:MAG: PD-(D/E)XK nuclease family protein [Thermodesulfobacteriota bacterium]
MKKSKKRHTLFCGPFHPELEEEFIRRVREKKALDPLAPVLVLVGSNLLRIYLQRLLLFKGLPHANLRFLTFIDLARLIALPPLMEQGRTPLPLGGELVIVDQLASRLNEESYFYPLKERRGFRRALLATFLDLWDSGFAALPLKEGKKLAELDALYQAFRAQITKKFFSEVELLSQASRYAASLPEKWGVAELFVYGFYDFTENQRRLLEACAQHLEIYAFMPWRKNPGFDYAWPTYRWFKGLGCQEEILGKPSSNHLDSLQVLHRDLFAPTWSEVEIVADEKVKIIAAANEVQEVKEIAREIINLAQEGIPFQEMAILLRKAEIYINIIKETFQNLGIPVFFAGGLPLRQTPEAKSVLLLVDLIKSNWPRAQVMEFLTFAPLAWSNFLTEKPVPACWDLISRQAGIIAGRKDWEEKLNLYISRPPEVGPGDEPEDEPGDENGGQKKFYPKEAAHLKSFLQVFFSDLDSFPTQGTWSVLATRLIELIEKYLVPGEAKQEIIKILQKLKDLDDLQTEVDLRQFKEILTELFKEGSLRHGAFQERSVCVAEIMPARGLSFRVVFIPGLVERIFPAAPRQDPLLLDQERLKINQVDKLKGVLPLKANRWPEEKTLFSLAVAAARERLVLSYPRLDPASGKERIPSFFLLQVGKALAKEIINYSKLETLPIYHHLPLSRLGPAEPEQAIDEQEFDLAQIRKALPSQNSRPLVYLFHLFPNLARAKRLAQLRWGMRLFTEYDGCLSSERAQRYLQEKHLLAGRILSPTKLEMYALCPFRYFLAEVLRLESYPSPEEILRLSPLAKGKVMHEILYRFYQLLLPELNQPLAQEKLAQYMELLNQEAEEVFAQAEKEGSTGLPFLWEIDQQNILQDLRGFLVQESSQKEDLVPKALELKFGFADAQPPAKMELPGGKIVYFRGRIDRVDFSKGGEKVRIIDYKTGKLYGQEDGFSGGCTLQLPLYLWAALQIWPNIDLSQSWAEYYCLSRREEYERLTFSGQNWAEKEKILKEIVQIIEEGIGQGIFFPAPAKKEACPYCGFERVCEHGRDVILARKKGDARAAAFLRMREIK